MQMTSRADLSPMASRRSVRRMTGAHGISRQEYAMAQTADTAETEGALQSVLPARELIAILDFGSQYSRLIARRVRECRVYCELLPASTTQADLEQLGAKGVILSGGPDSVY